MNKMEKASLSHAKEWLTYSRSKQAISDRENDIKKRADLDRKLGHSPRCTLSKCHHSCSAK